MGLNVLEPAPNSGVFVLPIMIAPAFLIRSTIIASLSGTLSLYIGDPNVVRIPLVSVRSFTAVGSPWSGPKNSPLEIAASAALAPSNAWSG